MISLLLTAVTLWLILLTHPEGLAGQEFHVLLILRLLPPSLSLDRLLEAAFHWRKLKQSMKEGWLLGNGICGMPLFWMSCRLPNSTKTQIKTVIRQLKQDPSVSSWHGPNLNAAKNQNHETTNLTIEEETRGFLQRAFGIRAMSSESTLGAELCERISGQFDGGEITNPHIFHPPRDLTVLVVFIKRNHKWWNHYSVTELKGLFVPHQKP